MIVKHSSVLTLFFFLFFFPFRISHLNLSVNFWCFACNVQNLVGRM
jgi:hypothetical protein